MRVSAGCVCVFMSSSHKWESVTQYEVAGCEVFSSIIASTGQDEERKNKDIKQLFKGNPLQPYEFGSWMDLRIPDTKQEQFYDSNHFHVPLITPAVNKKGEKADRR